MAAEGEATRGSMEKSQHKHSNSEKTSTSHSHKSYRKNGGRYKGGRHRGGHYGKRHYQQQYQRSSGHYYQQQQQQHHHHQRGGAHLDTSDTMGHHNLGGSGGGTTYDASGTMYFDPYGQQQGANQPVYSVAPTIAPYDVRFIDPYQNFDWFGFVQDQLEFYFSVENLVRDVWLRTRMDDEGFIPAAMFGSFNRLKQYGIPENLILDTARASNKLTVRNGGIRRKGDWYNWTFPPLGTPPEMKGDLIQETEETHGMYTPEVNSEHVVKSDHSTTKKHELDPESASFVPSNGIQNYQTQTHSKDINVLGGHMSKLKLDEQELKTADVLAQSPSRDPSLTTPDHAEYKQEQQHDAPSFAERVSKSTKNTQPSSEEQRSNTPGNNAQLNAKRNSPRKSGSPQKPGAPNKRNSGKKNRRHKNKDQSEQKVTGEKGKNSSKRDVAQKGT